jgi:hypothetical protein
MNIVDQLLYHNNYHLLFVVVVVVEVLVAVVVDVLVVLYFYLHIPHHDLDNNHDCQYHENKIHRSNNENRNKA